MDKALAEFCRMLRARSAEHRHSMLLVAPHGHASVMVGLLRQELDSMIRVIYLLTTKSRVQRLRFIKASLAGEKWTIRDTQTGKTRKVTDRDMVNRSSTLRHWTESVYRFGCAFIHLSNCHDYRARDPFCSLPPSEQNDIVQHLRYYHGGPISNTPTFADLVPLFPRVLDKVSTNLDHYIVQLESDDDLES